MITSAPETIQAVRLVSETFASVFRAYIESSDEVQGVIQDMCQIVNDPRTDLDDREAAFSTLIEALFPVSHDGELGIDIEDLRKVGIQESEGFENEVQRFDEQEGDFAVRLKQAMEEKGLTQASLAQQIGVGQPAISMMLNRHCRPQRRTVEKLADALGMKLADLWPSL